MTAAIDSVIIGGGHNGLVCAYYLAAAGQKIVVAEANDQLGGAAITREFAPGFRVSAGAHLLHMLPKFIVEEMELQKHGFSPMHQLLPCSVLAMDRPNLVIDGEVILGSRASDCTQYQNFMTRMRRFAAHLQPVMQMTPPRLGTDAWADQSALLRMAWQVRSLGRHDMRELLRIIGMNIYDLTADYLDSEYLRTAVAFDAVLGSNAGPRSPGTVLSFLARLAGQHRAMPISMPPGGMGALSDALAAAARAKGAELRTGARVARILVEDDRAVGVVLASGEEIRAKRVISNADPRTTFLKLLGAAHLDTGFVRRVTHFRDRGLCAKLHLALSAPVKLANSTRAAMQGRLLIAPNMDYIETAYNPTKYGECPQRPAMEIIIPSYTDSTLAPAGQHVLSAIVQYVPYQPREGWEAAREGFIANCLDTIEIYTPGFKSSVIAAELLTPEDIEKEFGISGGHWHHGELSFDQFFLVRPVPGAAQYNAPIAGLYLCGAGSHPGGGVMGIAGRNAARQVLKAA